MRLLSDVCVDVVVDECLMIPDVGTTLRALARPPKIEHILSKLREGNVTWTPGSIRSFIIFLYFEMVFEHVVRADHPRNGVAKYGEDEVARPFLIRDDVPPSQSNKDARFTLTTITQSILNGFKQLRRGCFGLADIYELVSITNVHLQQQCALLNRFADLSNTTKLFSQEQRLHTRNMHPVKSRHICCTFYFLQRTLQGGDVSTYTE